jgi:hypothetical protein
MPRTAAYLRSKHYLEHILASVFSARTLNKPGGHMMKMINEKKNLKTAPTFPTRRQMIAGVTLTVSGLAFGLAKARASTGVEISRSEESIHQENSFKASRHRVYEALTDTRQFNEVTKITAATDPGIPLDKSPTVISPEAGGLSRFSAALSWDDRSNLCRTRASSRPGGW